MAFRSLCVVCLFLFLLLATTNHSAVAADLKHTRIPGFERFYTAPLPDPFDDDEPPIQVDQITGGRILLTELNCVSCHNVSNDVKPRLVPKQAPVLDDIGGRVKVEWLRAYLANPHGTKPGTTMPNLLQGLPDQVRTENVEALVHFLASTGRVNDGRADLVAAAKGAVLFQTVGCLACHDAISDEAPRLPTSAPLPNVDQKYTVQSLQAFLKDPLKARPSGRMPDLGLNDEQIRSLAHYFVRGGDSTPNTKFALYPGSWQRLPDFSMLKPVTEGQTSGFDLSIANSGGNYAIRFTSHLKIAKEGQYRFWLGSDDGSKLIIDDTVIVNCDGVHPHEVKEGKTVLAAGFHAVVVEYFQGGGEATLEVDLSGPGLPRQSMSGLMVLDPNAAAKTPNPEKPEFTIDPTLVAKGRQLFTSIGCASCHQMKVDGQAIASELKAKPLADVALNAGCLSETQTGNTPRYQLSAKQREHLIAAIKASSDEAPAETIHRMLASFNCYACHLRDKLGGVEAPRNDSFTSLQKEMGDEGRLPPVLTGVGDKLRADWLRHLLYHSTEDRKNYMVTKMPKFGSNNVEPLVGLLGTVDSRPDTMPKAEFKEPEYRVKAAGRHLVGGQALSCIKCHDFGQHPSTGVRAINLLTMTSRIKVDWFYRYLLDPQVYRRGTRMPAPWPSGRATIQEVLDGDTNQQIQAVWLYLSDRDKASVPSGLIREPLELKPLSEPIIYRNFIEGAGSRAIGVGYPGAINLAFDANNMRLAMVWHGAFIDASRHWSGRGAGFEAPLGDDILPLPSQVPFVKLDRPDREFPNEIGRELGYRFLGYRLDSQQQPIFRYSFSGCTVEDHPVPTKGTGKFPELKRTLRIEGSDASNQLWYRPIAAAKIDDLGEGKYRIDNVWTMEVRASGTDKPVIRDSAGRKELLVPVRFVNGKAEITQNYVW